MTSDGVRALEVLSVGPGATVQDAGRPGWAAVGVPRSGALDRGAFLAANRILGNDDSAAAIEVTLGGLHVRALADVVLCVTGAPCPRVPDGEAIGLRPGEELRLGPPEHGMRTYVGVAGGVEVEPVLGSRSHDSLSGLGPPPLHPGMVLSVGARRGSAQGAPVRGLPTVRPAGGVARVWPGPRADWLEGGITHLVQHVWTVTADVSRVGLRLDGAPFRRAVHRELPSEGMVVGAVQVPHDGRPIVMLADHPTTGGYPVVAVVDPMDVGVVAQARPGDLLRFQMAVHGPGVDAGIG